MNVRTPTDADIQAEYIRQAAPANFVVRALAGEKMRNFEELFDEFASTMRFPTYFGRNFNALKDCLTDLAWLHGDGYVLTVRRARRVLEEEAIDDVVALLRLLQAVCEEWYTSTSEGESGLGRAAVPFHVVFFTDGEESNLIRTPLEMAGIRWGELDKE